ncbi:hypothetical protein ACFFKE_11375 [Streptomyces mutabilis]|uniref:hypothetical protein n=1 Tax=Streptomyces mutabilis TaxID=67332 RepID=UPI0035E6EEE1
MAIDLQDHAHSVRQQQEEVHALPSERARLGTALRRVGVVVEAHLRDQGGQCMSFLPEVQRRVGVEEDFFRRGLKRLRKSCTQRLGGRRLILLPRRMRPLPPVDEGFPRQAGGVERSGVRQAVFGVADDLQAVTDGVAQNDVGLGAVGRDAKIRFLNSPSTPVIPSDARICSSAGTSYSSHHLAGHGGQFRHGQRTQARENVAELAPEGFVFFTRREPQTHALSRNLVGLQLAYSAGYSGAQHFRFDRISHGRRLLARVPTIDRLERSHSRSPGHHA